MYIGKRLEKWSCKMGIFDIEEEEELWDDSCIQEHENRYLINQGDALKLIAKIIPLSNENRTSKWTVRKLDDMLDTDFLSVFRQMRLSNEAQLQMKLEQISDGLVEQKKFEILKNRPIIGIGGKFSAGKSKFINSILKAGEEFLPEAQNPTTSIPTYIVCGSQKEIRAYTSYNETVLLDAEQMQALTHKFYEKYNIGFSSFINSLIILEPDMPYRDLVFLDTPGYSKADIIGSMKNQKELTDENKAYAQLRNVDHLIWLMDIENGVLSETDIAFISRLKLGTPVLIVVNKADKKIDAEIKNVVSVVKSTALNAGINAYAVTAYSSWDGAEWRNANIIKQFLNDAASQKRTNNNILEQIKTINGIVSRELDEKIEASIKERDALSDVIFKSDDIKEIRTLVDIYGELMEDIRNMKRCRNKHQNNIRKLDETLKKYYDGR